MPHIFDADSNNSPLCSSGREDLVNNNIVVNFSFRVVPSDSDNNNQLLGFYRNLTGILLLPWRSSWFVVGTSMSSKLENEATHAHSSRGCVMLILILFLER